MELRRYLMAVGTALLRALRLPFGLPFGREHFVVPMPSACGAAKYCLLSERTAPERRPYNRRTGNYAL